MVPAERADAVRREVGPMVDFVDNWPAQLNRDLEDKAAWETEARMALAWHKKLVGWMFERERPDVFIHDTYVPNQLLESRWWLGRLDPASDRYEGTSPEERARAWEEMHDYYKRLDDILGEALARADEDTLIVFSSDHGIIPINKSVLLNNLFAREGLLRFTVDDVTGEPRVDWANTRAIYLKMHGVYVSPGGLAGNWRRGSGREYRRLRRRVVRLLKGLRDGKEVPLRNVLMWEEAGKLRLPADRVGDVIPVMEPGYGLDERMAENGPLFESSLQAGYKQALLADDVPGLWTPFIIVGPGVRRGYRIPRPIRHVDQAPTLLRLMGVPVPGHAQGRVLEEIIEK